MGTNDEGERDRHFMMLALAQAEAAVVVGQTPFGAVVVDESGKVIGEGHNQVRADCDPAAHGEIVALRNAWRQVGDRRQLEKCTLYSNCEPCLLCSFVITQFRLRRVVFAARGTDVPTYKPLLNCDLSQAAAWVNQQPEWAKLEIRGDFMRDEARRTIDAFDWNALDALPQPRGSRD